MLQLCHSEAQIDFPSICTQASAAAQTQVAAPEPSGTPGGSLKGSRGLSCPTRPDHEGAAWQRKRGWEGSLWLEVFCRGDASAGGSAMGRWVHLDHMQGWVDKSAPLFCQH